MATRTIKVDYLARVEGEGALKLKIRDGRLVDAVLNIFEPPRFFEAMLRGRQASEAPDITARICGICPVAYQMSAIHAIENAAGVTVEGPLRALRRLIYCGEWISSHTLHIYLLHAPDFLGYEDAVRMAKDHKSEVERGLALKKTGNTLMRFVGGREVHPINVRVGGFYSVPTRKDLLALREELLRARDMAEETVRWTARLPVPEHERAYDCVALRHETEYPFNAGRIVSTAGVDLAVEAYESRFMEVHRPNSTALYSMQKEGGPYLVGPLARLTLNVDRLPDRVRALAGEVGFTVPCTNPYRSIVARALEVLFACEEALAILDAYDMPDAPFVHVDAAGATGYGATEAPRGLLYHRYRIGHDGRIEEAKIVPPTSQNQSMIEADLRDFAANNLHMEDEDLQWRCEQMIRNYDPCISCATHFLKVTREHV